MVGNAASELAQNGNYRLAEKREAIMPRPIQTLPTFGARK
jgi:hypothetical protein